MHVKARAHIPSSYTLTVSVSLKVNPLPASGLSPTLIHLLTIEMLQEELFTG